MQPQTWLQAHIRCIQEQTESVEQILFDCGAVSVTLTDAADQPILENSPGEHPLWHAIVVTGLFAGNRDVDDLQVELLLKMQTLSMALEQLQLTHLTDQVWETVWMDQFRPMQFGEKLWIYPSHIEPDQDDDVAVIRLDPGLAFGSGTHATTRLCLEWIAATEFVGKTVLDYGCGSGVLAIAAALRGADNVLAIDHDKQALLATLENAKNNDIEDKINIIPLDQTLNAPVDVVVANILAGALIALAAKILASTKPGGDIVLSGILSSQQDDVMSAYRPYCENIKVVELEEWVCIEMNKCH